MGWESFNVVRFDLGPLLQGHPNLKVLITCLLLVVEVWDGNHGLGIFWCGQRAHPSRSNGDSQTYECL